MQGHVRGYIILLAREITAFFAKAADENAHVILHGALTSAEYGHVQPRSPRRVYHRGAGRTWASARGCVREKVVDT
jgi:hypothetical protein